MSAWPAPTGRSGKLRLDLNENNFVPVSKLKAALGSIPLDALTMYPEYERLEAALSRYTGRPASEIVLCNGADQGIELILRAFAARASVVLPVPTFSYYQHVAAPLAIELVKIPYTASFDLDVDGVLGALAAGARGVILVNPSNPLGTRAPQGVLRMVFDAAARSGAFVLVDEVYFEFAGESCADLLDTYDNLFVLRSFSKGFGLAGARLGYVLSTPRNLEPLVKLRGPWDVNAVGTHLALAALADPTWLSYLPVVREQRSVLERKLHALGLHTWPSATNFVVARGEKVRDILQHFAAHGVLVSDLGAYPDSFGMLQNCMRTAVPNLEQCDLVYELLNASAGRAAQPLET